VAAGRLTSTAQAELVAAGRRIAEIFVKVGLPRRSATIAGSAPFSPTSAGDTGAI
jgi:hypothetical protein